MVDCLQGSSPAHARLTLVSDRFWVSDSETVEMVDMVSNVRTESDKVDPKLLSVRHP